MVYRGSSKYHKIRKLETNTGKSFSITLSEEAANNFSGCTLHETVVNDIIILQKSGCDIIDKEKIALALR